MFIGNSFYNGKSNLYFEDKCFQIHGYKFSKSQSDKRTFYKYTICLYFN